MHFKNVLAATLDKMLRAGIVSVVSVFLVAGSAAAVTTINANIDTDGTLSVDGTTTLGDALTDILTFVGTLAGGSPFTFEGASADAFETIFAITDPTVSDKTITFPNASGTVALTSDIPAAGANAALSNLASVAINIPLLASAGTVCSAPAYAFSASATDGFMLLDSTRHSLGACVNGILAMRLDDSPDGVSTNSKGNTTLGMNTALLLNTSTGTTGGLNNTFIGGETGMKATTVETTTCVGNRTCHEMVSSLHTTAVGQGAGYYTTVNDMVLTGYHSGLNATTASQLTCYGTESCEGSAATPPSTNMLTGSGNTCIGYRCGRVFRTASTITGVGNRVLESMDSGARTSGFGYQALNATTESDNTCTGYACGISLNNGLRNTGNGSQAFFTTNGSTTLVSGSDNTAMGYGAGVSSASASNRGAFGSGAVSSADNTIQLGNTSVTEILTSGGLTFGRHLKSTGTAPSTVTTGTCTSETITSTSSDTRGVVTATCTIGQTVIVTFASAFAAAPVCVISSSNGEAVTGAAHVTASTSTMTITVTAAATAGNWSYHCIE